MACQCIKQQVGQGNGGVKGFITTQECEECKSAREAANVLAADRKLEQDLAVEKENLIQDKLRHLATGVLQAEGKIDEAGMVVKPIEVKVEPVIE